jgi:uncharacterized protein YjaZ
VGSVDGRDPRPGDQNPHEAVIVRDVRGTELTPSVESTLVHELTHALQFQHFDLGKHHEELEEADDSAASSAYTALVEGDARRIQAAWRENLSEEEQEALWESEAEQGERVKSDSGWRPQRSWRR